jgi:hypothetical protein
MASIQRKERTSPTFMKTAKTLVMRTQRTAPAVAPTLIWNGAEYPRIEPGRYLVRGQSFQGPQWIRTYQRWSIRVEFGLVEEPGSVSVFFNLGNDPAEVHIGRKSNYFKAWTLANGGLPTKGKPMTADVFLQGQFFLVSIADATKDSEGLQKEDAEVYSRITDFHSVQWP